MDNLAAIAKDAPQLKYVQLDDGYQPAMGDWLETGKAFGGDVQGVLQAIRKQGFEPAIWVAPFIAEAGSHLFQQHPDWFMKGDDGKPLPADKVTFQGWRRGPWYALDGTNPEVQKHLENVFRTMRRDWGVTYFKLDANFWGAMHGGKLHDPEGHAHRGLSPRHAGRAARARAIASSWAAIIRSGPSFGLIHGSRSSGDIKRTWDTFQKMARQNLLPQLAERPALVERSRCRHAERRRCRWKSTASTRRAIMASGGMVLSGDDLSTLPADRLAMLKKLLPPTGVAAEFEDESLTHRHGEAEGPHAGVRLQLGRRGGARSR